MNAETARLLETLRAWAERGWLRRLDSAFAGFVASLDAGAAPRVVASAALVAQLEGQGHTALDLDALLHDARGLLGWPAVAAAELDELLAGLSHDAHAWRADLKSSRLVAVEGEADGEATGGGDEAPLVLRGNLLYLRRYWRFEKRVAAQVLERSAVPRAVDEAAARRWLDRLFPPAPAGHADGGRVDWQKIACAVALRGRLTVVTGGPGTGKTHTAARLLALLFAVDPAPGRLRVALAAPTGKAAARLKQSIDGALLELSAELGDDPLLPMPLAALAARIGPARTLHALLGARPDTRRFGFDAAHPLALDVLIVDEASMVHLEMMAALLDALPPHARVVLLGDKDQLASVEAGAVLGDLCTGAGAGYAPATAAYIAATTGERLPEGGAAAGADDGAALAQQTVMLVESRRFGGPIGRLASAVNVGDAAAALALLREAPDGSICRLEAPTPAAVVRLALHGRAGAEAGYGHFITALHERPETDDRGAHAAWALDVLTAFERFRLLCAVHGGEWGAASLNLAVERALVGSGGLVKRGEWYEGRPVMVTRNDASLGVFNGDIGIVLWPAAPGAGLRAWFGSGSELRSVGVGRLAHVETAFAMTVHKSQGSEFEHAVLVLPAEPARVLTRELVYTGVTRARRAFTLASGRPEAFAEALVQRTQRSSGLAKRLGPPGAGPASSPPR